MTASDQIDMFRRVVQGVSFGTDDLAGAAAWQAAWGATYTPTSGPFRGMSPATPATMLLTPLLRTSSASLADDPLYTWYLAADPLKTPVEPVSVLVMGAR